MTHKKHLHHHKQPPHALPVRNKNKLTFLGLSIVVSTAVTSAFASIMSVFGIPITVVLPTSAPILMGFTTIGYMMQTEVEK